MLGSISEWDQVYQPEKTQGKGIAVFRSPDAFEKVWLDEPVTARAVFGSRFYVRPLLPKFARDPVFYILALSQKDVRLLRCTTQSSEQIDFSNGVATNFERYLNTAKPDHVRDNRATAGPGSGSSKGILFGTGSDLESRTEYLAHFFRQIDRGLRATLRENPGAVVLAGVEYELSLYRSISTYGNLVPEGVQGAPNSLKGGEMHARALAVLERRQAQRVEDVLQEYDRQAGRGATHRLKEVVLAAHDGRVRILVVSDSLEHIGRVDETMHQVRARKDGLAGEEDLVNHAAIQTILHSGQVLVAPNKQMPKGSPVAAVLRF